MHGNILILAGIDGLGKTPLANLIRNEMYYRAGGYQGRVQVRQVIKDPRTLTRGLAQIYAARETRDWDNMRDDDLYIYDRFPYPDDYIYGDMSTAEVMTWHKWIAQYPVKFVYIEPSDLTKYVVHQKEHPDIFLPQLQKPSFARGLLDRYEVFFEFCRVPVMDLNWQSFHPRHAVNILDWVQKGKDPHYGTLRSNRSGSAGVHATEGVPVRVVSSASGS